MRFHYFLIPNLCAVFTVTGIDFTAKWLGGVKNMDTVQPVVDSSRIEIWCKCVKNLGYTTIFSNNSTERSLFIPVFNHIFFMFTAAGM